MGNRDASAAIRGFFGLVAKRTTGAIYTGWKF
jgi:hypothetical protein